MKLKKSERNEVKLRLGISGASGFGKTKSALLLAYGMTNNWSKIAIIDSENSSASLYSDMGSFNVLDLRPPYSPERYIEAISICENAEMEVIIIDSITHEWNGTGGCLDIHEKLGGRFQDWANVTPRHQAFLDKILQSKCHIITTTRRKIEYDLDKDQNGKLKVQKFGTKEITREGFEYELTINFELINENHLAKASKDRTGLFMNKPEFVITPQIGKQILDWCNIEDQSSKSNAYLEGEIKGRIKECSSISELLGIYNQYPQFQQLLRSEFDARKTFLIQLTNPNNYSSNGSHFQSS